MISEGQRNDITYAVPLLEQIDIKESRVLADKGYDSNHLIDYIYDPGGEPTIPSRKGAKFEQHCDWYFFLIYILSFFNNLFKNNRSPFFDTNRQSVIAHKKSPSQTPYHASKNGLFILSQYDAHINLAGNKLLLLIFPAKLQYLVPCTQSRF